MSADKFDVLLELVKSQWEEMRKWFEQIDKRFDLVHEELHDVKEEVKEIRHEFIKPLQKWEKIRQIAFTWFWWMASLFIAIIASWISSFTVLAFSK